MSSASIVPLEDVNVQQITLRGKEPLVTDRGSYLSIAYQNKPFYIVVGTKEEPARTPHGVKLHDNWESFSVDSTGAISAALAKLDSRFLDLLPEGATYKPLEYTSGGLGSLSGRLQNVQVVDENNAPISFKKTKDLPKVVTENSLVRALFKLESIYFPPDSQEAKVLLKVSKIQLLQAGAPELDMFEFN
jgi:hypothetical protein